VSLYTTSGVVPPDITSWYLPLNAVSSLGKNFPEESRLEVSQLKVSYSHRSLNSSTSRPEEPAWVCYVAGPTGLMSGWVALKCQKLAVCPWSLWDRSLSSGVSFLFFFCTKWVLLCLVVGGGGFRRPWDHSPQGILLSLRTLTNKAKRIWTRPDKATRGNAPGRQLGSCGSVWRGRGGDRYSQRR